MPPDQKSPAAADRYLWQPPFIAVALWLATVMPIILSNLGSPPLWVMLAVLVIPLATLPWALSLCFAAYRRQWRRAAAITAAAAVFGALSWLSLAFREDIRIEIARLSILAEISRAPAVGASQKISRLISNGGPYAWSVVEYDAADRPVEQSTNDKCSLTVKPLDHHFFLKTFDCFRD